MWEIIITIGVVLAILAFFGFLIGRFIYKKKHNMPVGECACCQARANKFVKEYHKKYSK